MNNNIHVAQVIDSLGEGGAERLLLTFSEAAKRRGITVTIISLTDDTKPGKSGFISAQMNLLGVKVITIDSHKLYNPLPLFKLIYIFLRERFDVVQAHLSHGIILAGMAGWMTRTPVVATLHNPSPRQMGHFQIREAVWAFVLKYMVKRVVVVGRIIWEAYKSRISTGKMDLVLNAVGGGASLSRAECRDVRMELTGSENSKIIFCVGRLIDGKGLYELLSAFSTIYAKYSDLFLVIVGDGDLRERLVLETERLHVSDRVKFLGFRNDVRRILGAGDIYVSASYSEGMSVALLEAMASGLPIIATAVGEAPYLLGENRGILIPPGSVSAISNGFTRLLEDPDYMLRMRDSVREYARIHCSPEIWLDRLTEVYAKAMGNRS